MAKFSELKIQQLKKELESRGLNTTGIKLEPQARLREAIELEAIDVEEYDFHLEGEETTKMAETVTQAVTSTDLNMILAAISAQTSTVASQLESQKTDITSKLASQLEEQKTYMSSQLEEEKTYLSSQMESQETRITSKMETQLKEQEARITVQLEAQEARISSKLEARMDEKIMQFEEKIEAEVDALRGRIQELQLHRPAVSASNPKVKTPSFDGSVPFQVFKLQFEKTAAVNNCNTEDKVAALFVALKGPAAEILQTIPEYERNSYEALMAAVERRYGSEHRKQIYQIELQNRYQKANETLQEFVSDIERLAHLANADAPVEYTERVKIQSFINGIRDVETERATYANPKQTFSETVFHALTQHTSSSCESRKARVGKTLAMTKQDGRFPIRVLNEFNSPIKLTKGAILGRCQEADVIINCEQLEEHVPTSNNDLSNDIMAWTEELEEDYQSKAKQLLLNYANIFDQNGFKPGRTKVVKHQIDTGDARPIRQAPRSVPLAKREVLSQIVQEMNDVTKKDS
ncbi:early endosome antigen 1-like [Eurosta solidaginis]|uniref:early endosome antigen 1-like n=1 Tax=Eurosta solidaginis TaxID=178769 RepID=UPI0035311D9A